MRKVIIMKEKIYTIPINESLEQDSECPFCVIEKKLETDAVEYALGAAMMEPDYRIISNEKGYCNKHFSMMFAKPNKLSLALVIETHIDEIIKNLKDSQPYIKNISKKSIFKKGTKDENNKFLSLLSSTQNSCVICDKIDSEIKRYTDVFFYMWQKDTALKEKVLNSKGFCMKHFSMLCENSKDHLKDPVEFISAIYNIQLENLERMHEDIHKFTLKFDYRNKDMPLGNAQDAPIRTIEKLRGYITQLKTEN